MLIQLNHLPSERSIDIGQFITALSDALGHRPINQHKLRVTLDWLQYRKSFRPPITARTYHNAHGARLPDVELAVDVRQRPADLEREVASVLDQVTEPGRSSGRTYLEESGRLSESIIWSFNAAYWRHLSLWESVFQRDFLAALPGGVTDSANPAFWLDRLATFVDTLDELAMRQALSDEIFVLELGVGGGTQSKIWLDTFRDLCQQRGRDYYARLKYLMTDFSHDVLRTARLAVGEHADRVSGLNVDITEPERALAFLRGKVLFAHTCNLYDNLLTDEVARYRGVWYDVRVRAYLPNSAVDAVAERHSIEPAQMPAAIHRLLRIGPDYFSEPSHGVGFWADVWDVLRLEESYVAIPDPHAYFLPGEDYGVRLSDLGDETEGNLRMHVSTGALRSFAGTLPLLHPHGAFQIQDLFTTGFEDFQNGFRGPGKMDGSIVNWLNGSLFRMLAANMGFDVQLEPFRYRERSKIVVLTATPRVAVYDVEAHTGACGGASLAHDFVLPTAVAGAQAGIPA